MKQFPGSTETENDGATMVADTPLPYPIKYSSDFEIGDPQNCQVLLDLWKYFDVNTLDKGISVFADEVRMDCADGTSVIGTPRSFIEKMKQQRSTFSSYTSSVYSIVSLKPLNTGGSWACAWGYQTGVTTDGKSSTVMVNENWAFNEDGKVFYIWQLSGTPQPDQK